MTVKITLQEQKPPPPKWLGEEEPTRLLQAQVDTGYGSGDSLTDNTEYICALVRLTTGNYSCGVWCGLRACGTYLRMYTGAECGLCCRAGAWPWDRAQSEAMRQLGTGRRPGGEFNSVSI